MRNRSSWIFLLAILFVSCSKSSFIEDVNRVPVITSDIDLFYGTLDRMINDGYYESIVQTDYFDRGSNGLKALISKDKLKAKDFADYMHTHEQFFLSIRSYMMDQERYLSLTQEVLGEYDRTVPNSKYKPIYFLIGYNMHGGTVTDEGVIIEAQKNILGLSDISWGTFDSLSFSSYDDLDQLIAHEQVHVMQPYMFIGESLLRLTLNEGIADFIAYKVVGKKGYYESYEYGDQNFEVLKKEWTSDLNLPIKEVRSKWLFNWGRKKDRPYDMGYYMGFKIAESYYEHNGRNAENLREMIYTEDFEALYERSGFID